MGDVERGGDKGREGDEFPEVATLGITRMGAQKLFLDMTSRSICIVPVPLE